VCEEKESLTLGKLLESSWKALGKLLESSWKALGKKAPEGKSLRITIGKMRRYIWLLSMISYCWT
jgi:hypothetical protein